MPPGVESRRARLPRLFGLPEACLCLAAFVAGPARAEPALSDINNYVSVAPLLSVSGQPTAAQLEVFRAKGIEAVLYIAPPQVSTSVRDEPLILGRQGLLYANVPVDFSRPTQADFDAFSQMMKAWKGRRVHVHCQVNMRGSVFMFLYRAVHEGVPPDQAYQTVRQIWVPDKTWSLFITETLKRHGLRFEAF